MNRLKGQMIGDDSDYLYDEPRGRMWSVSTETKERTLSYKILGSTAIFGSITKSSPKKINYLCKLMKKKFPQMQRLKDRKNPRRIMWEAQEVIHERRGGREKANRLSIQFSCLWNIINLEIHNAVILINTFLVMCAFISAEKHFIYLW